MKLILFSKLLKDKDIPGLIHCANELGIDGYDLCVRDGHIVQPDNAQTKLPELVGELDKSGLAVPMVTGPTDLVWSDHPAVEPLLRAMATSGVSLLKLGYARIDPEKNNYWQNVDDFRENLSRWEKLGETYSIKVCYHTHSGDYLGLNCAALMHLLQGFNPKCIGAYIDPGHMVIDGEPWAIGVTMVREYLSIVGLKDVLFAPHSLETTGETVYTPRWIAAGRGTVVWSEVFNELVRLDFSGPLSIHAEFKAKSQQEFWALLQGEVAFLKNKRDAAVKRF